MKKSVKLLQKPLRIRPGKMAMLTIFLFLFSLSSCNDRNDFPVEKSDLRAGLQTGSTNAEVDTGTYSLGLMYLENFHDQKRNQLAKLIADDNYKEIVFQLYKTQDGHLTLAAFAGKQNNNGFNPDFQVLYRVKDKAVLNLDGKNVLLGDQELTYNSGFKMLRDALNKDSVNDTTKNYVIFRPQLQEFTSRQTGIKSYIVEYSIYFAANIDDFDISFVSPSSGKLNPSPPYN